jgi:hypothetical protein
VNGKNQLAIMQELYRVYRELLPKFPTSCPVTPGKYYQYNITVAFTGFIEFHDNPLVKRFYYPNGLYKFDFLAWNKDDPKFFQSTVLMEVKKHFGETEF